MANTKIITDQYSIERVRSLQTEIAEVPHYIFTAKITEYIPSDDTVPVPGFDQGNTLTTIYDNMIFGKKILPSDLCPMIPRSEWVSNTVYSQYSFNDTTLLDKTFYTAIQIGSNFNVYKCLYNNGNTASLDAPSGTDTTIFQTADGYIWKYMYSFDQFQDNKFSTINFMPVIENETIKDAAKPGTIDVINIDSTGSEYLNHLSSTFTSSGIRFTGDDSLYTVDSSASSYNNFYNGCTIKITSGLGEGQYRTISSYYISGPNKIVQLESPFDTAPSQGDSYEIMPTVQIIGDGNETRQAYARAIVDSSNIITYIEMLDVGQGYRKASASVLADNTVNITTAAEVSPSVSPLNGHGYDPFLELGAKNLSVAMIFNQSENGTIPIENDYRTVGILREPLYDNLKVVIDPSSQIGIFKEGEKILQYKDLHIPTSATIDTRSHFIVTSNSNVYEYLSNNDSVVFSDGVRNFYSTVDYILANNYFRIMDLPSFTASGTTLSLIKPLANAEISELDTNYMILDSVSNSISNTNPRIIGLSSFATCKIDFSNTETLTISSANTNEFRTFNQLTTIEGIYDSNVIFQEDETIYQGSSNAVVHSTVDTNATDTIRVMNIYGDFNSNSQIVSNTSLAAFTMTNKYPGNLKLNSGKILYIENVSPITRSQNTSELIKIILTL